MNKQLPNFTDSAGRILVPISEASKILGVSQQTLRRWDEKGKIRSQRPDGKNRYFRVEDLQNLKTNKKFTISEAAEFLGISQTTLRRLDEKGIVPADRLGDDRVYELGGLEEFMSSQYFQTKRNLEQISKAPQDSISERLDVIEKTHTDQIPQIVSVLQEEDDEIHGLYGFRKKAIGAVIVASLISFVLVGGLTFSFLKYPLATSQFIGYRGESGNKLFESPNVAPVDQSGFNKSLSHVLGAKTGVKSGVQNLVRTSLSPFSRVALAIVEKVDPQLYRQVVPRDINDIFAIDENGKLIYS